MFGIVYKKSRTSKWVFYHDVYNTEADADLFRRRRLGNGVWVVAHTFHTHVEMIK